jgi:hypothetical protein
MVGSGGSIDICAVVAEPEKIVWEVGLGGSLVQKPQSPDDDREAVETILVLVSPSDGDGMKRAK